MADPRFFSNAGPFSLADIAERCEAILPEGKGGKQILDVAPLDTAGERHICFLENKSYREQAMATKAAACFVTAEEAQHLPDGCVPLISKYPYRSYALCAWMFYPNQKRPLQHGKGPVHVHKSVQIHPSAVIGGNVKIGENTIIDACAVIAQGVEIGDNCYIAPHVSISHALIGNNVRLFPGVRIGQPGFGYAIDPRGNHLYVPQLGRVIIEDNVDIGANSTVDRGAGPDTIIGAGTKIDNLCQIAHNVQIGKGCFLASMVGISGSTKVGNGVFFGGQSGAAGHLKIVDGAQIAAQTGILRDIDSNKPVMGTPAVPLPEFLRREAWLRKIIRAKKDA